MKTARYSSMTLLILLWTCIASGEEVRFCATERYAAVGARSSEGVRLWILDLKSEDTPSIRQQWIDGVPKAMACADATVYLRYDKGTQSLNLKSNDLEKTPGIEWHQVKKNKGSVTGTLKTGKVYYLPNRRFRLALMKAKGKFEGDSDEITALILATPNKQILVYTLYTVRITLH